MQNTEAVNIGHVLQAHLVLQKINGSSSQNSSKDIYSSITDADIKNTFENPDNLPRPIRNFMLLQNEMSGRDTGIMLTILLPDVAAKYFPEGHILRKKKDDERRAMIARFLESFGTYARHWRSSYINLQDSEVVLQRLEQKIKFAKKALPKNVAEKFDPLEKEIQKTKENLQRQRAALENTALPDEEELERIDTEIEREADRIDNIGVRFIRKWKSITKFLQKSSVKFGKAAWGFSASLACDLQKNLLEFRQRHWPAATAAHEPEARDTTEEEIETLEELGQNEAEPTEEAPEFRAA